MEKVQSQGKPRILFIKDWFGPDLGGAEKFIFELSLALSQRGAVVEVWATDCLDLIRRDRKYEPDRDRDLPFPILRFPTVLGTSKIFYKIHDYINRGYPCPRFLAELWKMTNIRGKGMKKALIKEHSRFDSIHLCHYLCGAPHLLAQVAPDKTIIHPFFHKEPFLNLSVMQKAFKSVRGVFCNTDAEIDLAMASGIVKTSQHFFTIGVGVEKFSHQDDFNDSAPLIAKPFLLYIGRLVRDKNVHLLVDWCEKIWAKQPDFPDLVLVGKGSEGSKIADRHPKIHIFQDIDEREKGRLLRQCAALVNLSEKESFSLVIMEAWLEGTPVIVHKNCQVTENHVATSRGGKAVGSQEEFKKAVTELHKADAQRKFGQAGKAYVQREYNWDAVCQRFNKGLTNLGLKL